MKLNIKKEILNEKLNIVSKAIEIANKSIENKQFGKEQYLMTALL